MVGHHYVLFNPIIRFYEQDVKYYFLRCLSKATCQRATKLLALSFVKCVSKKAYCVVHVLRRDVFEVEPPKVIILMLYLTQI